MRSRYVDWPIEAFAFSVHNTGRTFLVPLVEACLLPQIELGSSGKAHVGPPSVSPVCCCLCCLAPQLLTASLLACHTWQ